MQLEKQLYSAQIIEVIKSDLLHGILTPGDKVNEVQLAQRLGISRAPVREALSLLEKEGLVISTPQKGKSIVKLTTKEVLDSYITGGILEGKGVAMTCHLFTQEDFHFLEKLLASIQLETIEHNEHLNIDELFHETLLKYQGNTILVTVSRQLSRKISKFLLLRYWQQESDALKFHKRHYELLKIIETKDPALIEEAIVSHYRELGNNITNNMLQAEKASKSKIK